MCGVMAKKGDQKEAAWRRSSNGGVAYVASANGMK